MYNHQKIEKKWQKYWEENNTFKTSNTSLKPKYYVLDMFPYPSGAGLHVGHPEGYTANDIVARYKHAKGHNVLHPMGWDAFGLPAENYAIKTGTHPRITTDENIKTFKRQIKSLGFSYDWDREIDTTDPEYFKWTQWIFLKLFEQGLAYEQDLPINYCPSCKTGLANEEVLRDFSCERCGTIVEKKKIRQWVLGITKYAERLLSDVDELDWPEGIKDMQRNWIGKSEGCEFEMKKATPHPTSPYQGEGQNVASSLLNKEGIEGGPAIRVYTTRVDTVFGMTYAVIAPDHPDVEKFIEDSERASCEAYIKKASQQSDQDRTADDKEKTGVFTGSYVINPYNDEKVPLWIADYVLGNYGTGAVMAVPAHDERDWEFAKKYDLEIRDTIAPFIEITNGTSTPRSDENIANFRCATAIIKHWSENTYLVLQFAKTGEFGLVGGKREEGESSEQCILREIQEETGYKNYSIKEVVFEKIFGRGYKARKDREELADDTVYFIELENDEMSEGHSCDEHDNMIFLSQKDFLKKVSLTHHKVFFEQFLSKNKSYSAKNGILFNSGEYSGLRGDEAKKKFAELAEQQGFGHIKTNYKLRDWLFSRQRYWGEPIPLIHLEMSQVKQLPHISDISQATDENIAYILKRAPKDGEEVSDGMTCGGKVRELIIGGKVFSKIYDGLYGKIVCDYRLPLELPEVEAYEPAGDGQSPLAKVDDFVQVQLADNLVGKRETNTMPQWGGSCWYYLRFMDSKNPDDLVGSEMEKYWESVDSYVGGAEHAVLHLLYARFWHKFLFDIGVVSTTEPFYRLRNQGMILGMSYKTAAGKLIADDMVEEKGGKYFEKETGEELEKVPAKMSKSLKNVINPDDIVQEYGADTLRMYEMYMADFKDAAPWDTSSIVGVKRFLDRVSALFLEGKERNAKSDDEAMKVLHKTIKKVGEDIDNYKFNTAIAQMMICMNTGEPQDAEKKAQWRKIFIILLHPFAPHITEECWEKLYNSLPTPLFTIEGSRKYKKIYFATGNVSKIERAQKLLNKLDPSIVIEKYQNIIEVEETAKTSLECALQKLEVYKGVEIDAPIAVADTAVYFEDADFDFEPTKVKRTALELVGKKESDLSVEEVAELMIDYYQARARDAGGSIDYYYVDSWAILYPDGNIKTYEYRREYTLTDTRKGELKPYFPMANLYVSKYTGKRYHESTDEDFFIEFAGQTEALSELFNYGRESIFFADWPEYDEKLVVDDEVTIGVQVLGKLRGEIQISVDESKESVLQKAKTNENVAKWLEGKELVKEVYVPGKIVNLVVK